VTIAIVSVIVLVDSVNLWFVRNSWILWLFIAATFVIMIVLACCETVARKHPLNLILLIVFTVCESVLVGAISSRYKTSTVLIAFGITAFIVVALTLFAFQVIFTMMLKN
jgi:protein lifeguard